MLKLIDLLGGDNVFLSIYENDSGPGTVEALKELRRKLICKSESNCFNCSLYFGVA